jgi:hypothetical protein
VVRRRAIERERRRVDALTALAGQLEGVAASLRETRATPPEPSPRAPAPLVDVEPGGRAALVAATTDAVRGARAAETRLAVAVIEAADSEAEELGSDVVSAVGLTAYTVGPRSIAVVLPGASRAGALGVLARIQAACGATGHAVELEPDESAVELLARVLAPVPNEVGAWLQPRP